MIKPLYGTQDLDATEIQAVSINNGGLEPYSLICLKQNVLNLARLLVLQHHGCTASKYLEFVTQSTHPFCSVSAIDDLI